MSSATMVSYPAGGVLIASSSMVFRKQVRHSLPAVDGRVQEAMGGADALDKLETGDWQVLFLDRRLPDLDAEELMETIRQRFPGIEVVMLDSDSGRALPIMPSQPHKAAENFSSEAPLPGMIGQAGTMQRLYRDGATGGAARYERPYYRRDWHRQRAGGARHSQIEPPGVSSVRGCQLCCASGVVDGVGVVWTFARRLYRRGAITKRADRGSARWHVIPGRDWRRSFGVQSKLLRFLEQHEIQAGSAEPVRVDVRVWRRPMPT